MPKDPIPQNLSAGRSADKSIKLSYHSILDTLSCGSLDHSRL